MVPLRSGFPIWKVFGWETCHISCEVFFSAVPSGLRRVLIPDVSSSYCFYNFLS